MQDDYSVSISFSFFSFSFLFFSFLFFSFFFYFLLILILGYLRIVGANLFFTQAARLALEKEGVILFKDASANKGGVTSSSLEVIFLLNRTSDDITTLRFPL